VNGASSLLIPLPIPGGPALPLPGANLPTHIIGGIAHRVAKEAVHMWLGSVVDWFAHMDLSVLHLLWRAITATTRPVIGGPAWSAECRTMAAIAATVALPLVIGAAIIAIIRQDLSGLLRTVLVRVPLALVFTGAAIELVSLGLSATDQACAAVMHAAGAPLGQLFRRTGGLLVGPNPVGLAADMLLLVVAGALSLLVWLELAVRQAAVAVAALFLPLALAGSAFPATAHWARRLGETITALVLSKLAIVAVLALAASALGTPGRGIAAIVEAVTLLALTCVAPFALLRIIPAIEGGAASHLEGLGRAGARAAVRAPQQVHGWIGSASAASFDRLAEGLGESSHAGSRSAGSGGSGGSGRGGGSGGGGGPGSIGGIGVRPPRPPGPPRAPQTDGGGAGAGAGSTARRPAPASPAPASPVASGASPSAGRSPARAGRASHD
jgi:uncharacterized membrane protein YgcG